MRFTAVLMLLSIAPAAWSQVAGRDDASAGDVIGNCAETADEEAGIAELEAACPGLTRALEESGYLPLLTPAQHDGLSAYDLAGLQQLLERYRQPPATKAAPDTAALGPILASLREQKAERPLTWFERFRKWLRELLERQQQQADSQLLRWLENLKIPATVSTVILYASVALILVLALVVIVSELRAAGVLRGRRSAKRAGAAGQMSDAAIASVNLADLDAAPPEDRAPLLLRMLVSTLASNGRLRADRSLTHRELGVRAMFDNGEQRACFQRVADLAERVVYGSGTIPPDELEPIVAAGRVLNAQLAGART